MYNKYKDYLTVNLLQIHFKIPFTRTVPVSHSYDVPSLKFHVIHRYKSFSSEMRSVFSATVQKYIFQQCCTFGANNS
jgi:hypothetical protein